MSHLKVKVCGMNDEQNLISLLQIPIDFVGFIFYDKSPRNLSLSPEVLKRIFIEAEYKPKKVGVFVDEKETILLEKVETYELDYVQLHGKESLFYCESLKEKGIKIIKAFSVDDKFSFSITEAYKYYCDYFLFDTKGLLPGGNGTQFNWDKLQEEEFGKPFFLSGGIGSYDVANIRSLKMEQLFALDINSKFEFAPGVKNLEEVSEFNYKIKKAKTQNEYINVKRNEQN